MAWLPSPARETGGVGHALLSEPASLKIGHADDHRALRIEGEVLKSPTPIESPDRIVDRVRNHAEAPDVARRPQRRGQREEEQRPGVPLPMVGAVDRELPEESRG